MANSDWRGLAGKARERLRRLPKWAWAVASAAAVTLILLVALTASGPSYAPLYEGLTSKQGGDVIDNLQKLGIPYALNSSGSIISVPAPDLARARLQLGKLGVPADAGSEAWTELTQGSLTRGRDAIDALQKRALESSLEMGIDGISGVGSSQVSLAIPDSTPFLGDQPRPKASVFLHTSGAGVSPTQARAIAQMVAGSVPGLQLDQVTVTDQDGEVLAPIKETGYAQAQQEFDFRGQIERAIVAHVNALLAPLVGNDNFRVSASATIDFDKTNTQKTLYGPGQIAEHTKHETKHRAGSDDEAQGVPGALSNEPPMNASAAPTPAGAGTSAATAAAQSTKRQAALLPQSSSDNLDVAYDVDKITTVSQGAPWHLQAMSVSVVLNRRVANAESDLAAKVKAIVSSAISVPNLKINVAAVPFGLQHTQATHGIAATFANRDLLRSVLALLAALFVLFGIAVPLTRWLGKVSLPERRVPGPAGSASEVPPERRSAEQKAAADTLRRSMRVASEKPKEAAEMVKRWLADPAKGEAIRPDAQGPDSSLGQEVSP